MSRAVPIIAALAAALALAAPAAGHAAPHPCAAATERCDGQIEVPLDWRDPASERIGVAFAWVPRADRSRPAEGTILANLGGPSPALPTVPFSERALGPVLQRQNLLVVEPRGLGKSDPLVCPELNLADAATVTACVERLGERVQFFTADQAVADMNAVARALGASTVTFYGNSYGTLFAQAFATRYPESLGAVFLDSVLYTRPDGYSIGLSVSNAIRAGLRITDGICQPSRPCRALPGRATGRWARLLAQLHERPDSQLGVIQLLQLVAFVDDAVIGREVNAATAAYVRGDQAPLRRLARGLATAFPPDDSDLRDPEFAGTLAYVCGDSQFAFDRDASPERRRRQLDDFYASGEPYWPFTTQEVLAAAGGDYPEWCSHWPNPRPSPPVRPGVAYPSVPTLVVDGEVDSTTPPWDAAAIAERFSRATFLSVPFGSHASATGLFGPYSECVRDAMRLFVAEPRYPVPDPGCSGESYRALGGFPRASRDVAPARGRGLRGSARRLVAAAFATAVDALSRRNPYASLMSALTQEPGLRGGHVRYDDETGTVHLTDVRFVRDVAVSGSIQRAGDRATAELRVSRHDLRLSWVPFRAEDATEVTGALDGRGFAAWVSGT